MVIRKKFRVEMGHIVRNCSSRRCSHSQHGHSAIIEVLLEGSTLDNAGMLYDFGLMKSTVKEFIDMFDHCYVYWKQDNPKFIRDLKKWNERWIGLPFNPTAEMLSLLFMNAINRIIANTAKLNGEATDLHCCGVIYHETESGYAWCMEDDNLKMWNPTNLDQIVVSSSILDEISSDLFNVFFSNQPVTPKMEPCRQVEANACGNN